MSPDETDPADMAGSDPCQDEPMTATMADFFAGGGGGIPEPTYAGATVRDANGRLWEAAA